MPSTERVGKDKFVQFTYYITDDNGVTVEQADTPMSCVFGRHNRLYESVEKLMLDGEVGNEVAADITPEEGAWGQPDPNLIIEQSLVDVPQKYRVIGAEAEFRNDKGEAKSFFVTKIEDDKLVLDGNHPFAGKTMKFHLKITLIRDASMPEIINGVGNSQDSTAEPVEDSADSTESNKVH